MTSGARLLFDSEVVGGRVNVRSGPSHDRTLVFRSPAFTIDVFLTETVEGHYFAQGQVIDRRGQPVSSAEVHLDLAAEPCATDEFGQFAVSGVQLPPAAELRVRTQASETVCAIPDGARRRTRRT